MKTVLLFSAIALPESCRVENPDSGCCSWACLEASGRFLGIRDLDGLTMHRHRRALAIDPFTGKPRADSGGSLARIRQELEARGVGFQFSAGGSRAFLTANLESGVPVSLSVHGYPTRKDGSPDPDSWHAVLLLGMTETEVIFFDPNHPKKDIVKPISFLDDYWTGRAVALKTRKARRTPFSGVIYLPATLDPARREVLLKSVQAGKDACVACLTSDLFGYSREEAEQTAERIWRKP